MALAACALWLGGVEVLPALHEGLHDRLAPHRHDGGAIILVSFEDTTHRHPDGTIHVVAPRPHPEHHPVRDGRPHASGRADHAGGLAHHAVAILPSPWPVTQPLPVDRRPIIVALVRSVEPVARDPLAATARGPPRLA